MTKEEEDEGSKKGEEVLHSGEKVYSSPDKEIRQTRLNIHPYESHKKSPVALSTGSDLTFHPESNNQKIGIKPASSPQKVLRPVEKNPNEHASEQNDLQKLEKKELTNDFRLQLADPGSFLKIVEISVRE